MVNYKIAISGKARAGKNTVASLLVEHMGLNDSSSKIVALADPLKNIVLTMYPEASKECLWGPSELRSVIISKKYKDENGNPLTHRQALIELGAYGRRHNSNIWLNLLVMEANESSDKQAYIVSDVRFVNEFEYLKESGFYMIRVLRDDFTKINDPSEMEQDKIENSQFHKIIINNSSIEELSLEVKNIVKSLIS
jgi:hypothetical protein